jgi:putative transposase
MPGPIAKPLLLTPLQEEILRTMTRQHTAPQRLVRRVRIVLAAAEGLGLTETAQRLGLALSTVQIWRERWLQAGDRLSALAEDREALAAAIAETFADAPRSGTPVSFSAQEVAQIIALACEDPRRYGLLAWIVPISARPDLIAVPVNQFLYFQQHAQFQCVRLGWALLQSSY